MHCTSTVMGVINCTLPPMVFLEVAPDPGASAALAKAGCTATFRLMAGREWLQ